MASVDLKYAFGLKPEKAIEYFKSKGFAITWDWTEMLDHAHAQAFTVAKVLKLDVLQDIRDSLTDALDNGLTYQEWRKNLEPQLKAKGWWGEVVNPETGEVTNVGPWRLRTIFDTNIQTSYSAGRYRAQAENAAARPYLEYVAVMDARTRPAHAALNGTVLPIDDPFWNSFYPPNGWRCRCRTRALDGENIQERGLTVQSSEGRLGSRIETLKDGTEATVATFRATDPISGKAVGVAPDAGFSYNPGKTDWQPDPNRYAPELRRYLQ